MCNANDYFLRVEWGGESRMLHVSPRGKSTYIVLSEIQFKSKSKLSTNSVVKLKYTVKLSKWFTKEGLIALLVHHNMLVLELFISQILGNSSCQRI